MATARRRENPPPLAPRLGLLVIALLGCAHPSTPVSTESVRELHESFESTPGVEGKIYVLEAGDRGGPPLVLIHGIGDNAARDFSLILPALSERYHVLSFDLPGFGRSAIPTAPLDPEQYADFVQSMITQHFAGPVNVLGHSMGGAIAIQLASKYPASVQRLGLLDVAGILHWGEYTRSVVGAKLGQRGHIFDPMRRASRSLFNVGSRMMTGGDPLQQGIAPSPGVLLVRHDFGLALRSIQAPTWIGWGEFDDVAPMRTLEVLRYLIPAQEVSLYGQSQHAPMLTEPAQVARDFTHFLETTDAVATVRPASTWTPTLPLESVSCKGESGRTFEGDFDKLEFDYCKNVTLRNVRARSLSFKHTTATLTHVEVQSSEVGMTVAQSRVNWLGGIMVADVCLDLTSSRLNLVAVSATCSSETIRVRNRAKALASVSELFHDGVRTSLHGEYSLGRTPL